MRATAAGSFLIREALAVATTSKRASNDDQVRRTEYGVREILQPQKVDLTFAVSTRDSPNKRHKRPGARVRHGTGPLAVGSRIGTSHRLITCISGAV